MQGERAFSIGEAIIHGSPVTSDEDCCAAITKHTHIHINLYAQVQGGQVFCKKRVVILGGVLVTSGGQANPAPLIDVETAQWYRGKGEMMSCLGQLCSVCLSLFLI